jgi:hypothetical protein
MNPKSDEIAHSPNLSFAPFLKHQTQGPIVCLCDVGRFQKMPVQCQFSLHLDERGSGYPFG